MAKYWLWRSILISEKGHKNTLRNNIYIPEVIKDKSR